MIIFKILLFVPKYILAFIHFIIRWGFPLFIPIATIGQMTILLPQMAALFGTTAYAKFDLFLFIISLMCVLPLMVIIKLGPTFILYDKNNKTIFKYYIFREIEYKISSLAYDIYVLSTPIVFSLSN